MAAVAAISAAASVIHTRKTTPRECDDDDSGPTVRLPLGGATSLLMNGTDRRPGHVVRVFYTVAPSTEYCVAPVDRSRPETASADPRSFRSPAANMSESHRRPADR